MKKLLLAVMAFLFLCACSGEQDMIYRGLSMKMPCNSFINEMAQRGFAIDSAAAPDSTGRVIVMKNPAEKYHIIIGQKNDTIQAIREIYKISTNDSTRRLWQQLRDGLEKETGKWPNCPMLKDDHKMAKFELDGGFITITLENTYTPNLFVLYEVKK